VVERGAGLDARDELFGEEEFVDEEGGTVDLSELAFFVVGSCRHRDHVADATIESNLHGERVVTGEVIQMQIEEQDIRGVFYGEMQCVFQVSCNTNDVG
jgi:hypothetical protein